jgi:hypothetical protein
MSFSLCMEFWNVLFIGIVCLKLLVLFLKYLQWIENTIKTLTGHDLYMGNTAGVL